MFIQLHKFRFCVVEQLHVKKSWSAGSGPVLRCRVFVGANDISQLDRKSFRPTGRNHTRRIYTRRRRAVQLAESVNLYTFICTAWPPIVSAEFRLHMYTDAIKPPHPQCLMRVCVHCRLHVGLPDVCITSVYISWAYEPPYLLPKMATVASLKYLGRFCYF